MRPAEEATPARPGDKVGEAEGQGRDLSAADRTAEQSARAQLWLRLFARRCRRYMPVNVCKAKHGGGNVVCVCGIRCPH